MIYDELKNWNKIPGFKNHPVWKEAFKWIEGNAETAEEGIHPLTAEGCFVRVMSYGLKERDEARYESHLHTIDLQYTIEGAEGIEVYPVDQLQPVGEYLEDKDFQFYQLVERGAGRIDNLKGHFCVLFPQDGHMPQLYVPGHENVKKLVVKIAASAIM